MDSGRIWWAGIMGRVCVALRGRDLVDGGVWVELSERAVWS